MDQFYLFFSIVLLLYPIHFILIYRRYKREGDDFTLHLNDNSWKRLENYPPYMILFFGLFALRANPIEAYLIEIGFSDVLILICQVLASVLLFVIATFGFKFYLKAIGRG